MIRFADTESELLIDDVLAPIWIVTWTGPVTMPLALHYIKWSEAQTRASKAAERSFVVVHDCTAVIRPDSEVRKALADIKNDTSVLIKTYVIITNPLVRGAMTAIGWLMGDSFDVVSCKTMAEALPKAFAFARAAGLDVGPEARIDAYQASTRASGDR